MVTICMKVIIVLVQKGDQMPDNKQINQNHYCNTCKHALKPMTQAPCSKCVPRVFGGIDRWEARETQDGSVDKGIER